MVSVRVSLKLEASWDFFFFAKDRMAPEANRFNSFVRILENAISSRKNKQTKKPQKLVWKFVETETHENTWN